MKKQTKLKTLSKTDWESIEINEVFAYQGCWFIMTKIDDHSAMCLANDQGIESVDGSIYKFQSDPRILVCEYYTFDNLTNKPSSAISTSYENPLYKLPKKTQQLWRED